MSVLLAAVIIYSGFSVFFCYATIAPFFPPELATRHLDPLYNSIVFGVYAISYVVFSVLTKRFFIPALGRVATFVLADLLQIIAIIMLGLLPLIQTNSLFLATSIFARFLQGGGGSV